MPRFIGLDVHRKTITVCVLEAEGEKRVNWTIPTTREAITEFAERYLTSEDQVALEATTNTWAVADILWPYVARVVVSNPMQTRAIAAAKVKTDAIDALTLARLLRAGYLPEVWQPDLLTRRKRQLTHHRTALVQNRTGHKNRIHAVLAERLIQVPCDDLFSVQGQAWLASLDLDDLGRSMIESELAIIGTIDEQIAKLDLLIAQVAYEDRQVKLMMTIPGVNRATAVALLAAWGDINRFRDADHAASYLGLVPSTRQSGTKTFHGRITKRGNSHARFFAIQAAQHFANHPGPLGAFFRRLAKKKNRNIAVTAVARKIAVIAWHMLRNNEPYRYADPRQVQTKLSALRIAATGERRRGGTPKGAPRPAAYGTGQGTRKIPSLDEVCRAESLPTPRDSLPTGEIRMLKRMEVLEFARSVREERRVPRRRKAAEQPGEATETS